MRCANTRTTGTSAIRYSRSRSAPWGTGRMTGSTRGGRLPARPDSGPAGTERPRPPGEAWTTGAAQRALALEPGCFRYAYRSGHAARRCDVTRSLENPMETITSVAQTREGAACSLRTSRTDALLIAVRRLFAGARQAGGGVREKCKDERSCVDSAGSRAATLCHSTRKEP